MAETSAGLVTLQSAHSVDETVARIRALLAAKQIQEFALIDHSGEAAKVGLTMPKTQVLIFGNPKGGTPLMLAAPSVAIDLPLKLRFGQRRRAELRPRLAHLGMNQSAGEDRDVEAQQRAPEAARLERPAARGESGQRLPRRKTVGHYRPAGFSASPAT